MTRDLLTELQRDFAGGLLDVQQVEGVLPIFKGDFALNRERFFLYRGNITAIWHQTLANAFPVLEQLVGAEFFTGMARGYGIAYPSQSGNLAEFGAALPAFLHTLESVNAYPYLPDVAALEWQLHRAYYAQQLTSVPLPVLASYTPEQLPLLRVEMQPGCALLASGWDCHAIWLAHQQGAAAPLLLPTKLDHLSQVLVWRDAWQVRVSALSAASFAALSALRVGENFGAALNAGLELAEKTGGHFDVATELASWFERQLICKVMLEDAGK
jgi:hypothetical protein